MNLNVLYIDYEHAVDKNYAAALGLTLSAPSFLFTQPDSFEQGINVARTLIESGEIGLFVVDSVAAMSTNKELVAETGGNKFQDRAKLMAEAMRQLTPLLNRTKTLAIFLNHEQELIDLSNMGKKLAGAGVSRKTTPGGHALKYHASISFVMRLRT